MTACNHTPLTQGQRLPDIRVQQLAGTDLRQIDLDAYVQGKTVVLLGVPGAFTAPCSERHLPGYLTQAQTFRDKGVDAIVVLATSNFFAVRAWAQQLQPDPIFQFMADGSLTFTRAAGMIVDFTDLGLGLRTQRYAAVLRRGEVERLFVEPDATEVTVSGADNLLKHL